MMTTANPPSYPRLPAYTAEPLPGLEQRIALNQPASPRHRADFVKQSRNGGVSLRLAQKEDNIAVPIYGYGEAVEGTVEISKTDNITSVEVKIKGTLRLNEIAEGGKSSHELCLNKLVLWRKGDVPCVPSLSFSLTLPTEFSDEHNTYPLPPTYECHLTGFPGFMANIEYFVGVTVTKSKSRTSLFSLGNLTISTPFIYFPRSRPANPLPGLSMLQSTMGTLPGLAGMPDWRCFALTMKSRYSLKGGQDIETKLYIPSSRVFSITQTIPFFITFVASSVALAAFMPLGPTASLLSPIRQYTQIRLLRQSIVSSRNFNLSPDVRTKNSEIWNVVSIGQGSFKFFNDGPDWMAFCGEIAISDTIKNPGFKAAGLFVRDYISFTMVPPDPLKSPFNELRLVIPVQLTTDPWNADSDVSPFQRTYMESDSFEGIMDTQPELPSA